MLLNLYSIVAELNGVPLGNCIYPGSLTLNPLPICLYDSTFTHEGDMAFVGDGVTDGVGVFV